MIKLSIEITPEGLHAVQDSLLFTGDVPEQGVPVSRVLRVLARLIDDKARALDVDPVMLVPNRTLNLSVALTP